MKSRKLIKVGNKISVERTAQAVKKSPLEIKIINQFTDCQDFKQIQFFNNEVSLFFLSTIVDGKKLDVDILNPLSLMEKEEAIKMLLNKNIEKINNFQDLSNALLTGNAIIFIQNKPFTYNVYGPEKRAISPSETESTIMGAHDAFIEEANANLSLIRRRIKSPKLKAIKLVVGELTKTDILIIYIEDIVNKELVTDIKKRIEKVVIDSVFDTNMLSQLIDENPNSLFPQFYNTELPDVVRSKLVSGKIAIIVDGSPIVITAPSSFFEFVQSPEDYNQRWLIGSSLRLLRALAVLITLTFTAFYVAVVTFHYEILPENILITIAESRARVPFPPLIEALLMEITLELLREAGARLPTKVGQTIGIVGGIVIGQAAVDAGLTSNVLIIAVASSAIASFVLPSYNMSNAIRIARFSFILLAGAFGLFGLFIGVTLMVIHLVSLTSLQSPYLIPVSPLYINEWKDIFIRGPYSSFKNRPKQSQTPNKEKM